MEGVRERVPDFFSSSTVNCHDSGLLWKLPPPHVGASPIATVEEHWGLTYNRLSWPPVFFGSCPHLTSAPDQSQLKESTVGSPTIGRKSRFSSLEVPPSRIGVSLIATEEEHWGRREWGNGRQYVFSSSPTVECQCCWSSLEAAPTLPWHQAEHN